MRLIDTHCHLDIAAFDADRDEVVQQAKENGVESIIVPAIDFVRWDNLLDICSRYEGVYPALGLHPVFIEEHKQKHLEALPKYIEQYKPIAVGEIGLDFFVKELDKEKQIEFVTQQLEIAKQFGLPVILHVRKAHAEMIKLLEQAKVKGGICHAFNGDKAQAYKYIDLNFKLGFGGMITYERSVKLRKLATELPIESIVLETDAPDMPVLQHQGERNSPAYLPDVFETLSGLRKIKDALLEKELYLNSNKYLSFSLQ